jgi:hypothetical protein
LPQERELELATPAGLSNLKMVDLHRLLRHHMVESAQEKTAGAMRRAAELDSVIDRIQAELMTPGRLENATTGQLLRLHEAFAEQYESAKAVVERAIETADKLAGG